jgi:hypothetical protein
LQDDTPALSEPSSERIARSLSERREDPAGGRGCRVCSIPTQISEAVLGQSTGDDRSGLCPQDARA